MSSLSFPTIAEQAVAEWKACTRTTSFETVAKRHGSEKQIFHDFGGKQIKWYFDDDSRATARGRGRSYKLEAHLP